MNTRYMRQIVFKGIGEKGQRRLTSSRIAIIGLGAVGSMAANCLARAGVGFIRLIDRDFVDESNIQRQFLYDEQDLNGDIPKATIAYNNLKKINSTVQYEAVVADANASTIDAMIQDVDLVLDGTDNFESRFLINEACLSNKKTWIYANSSGSSGMIKAFLYGEDKPCLRCMMSYDGAKNAPTCATEGILNTASSVVAFIQSNEALKILVEDPNVMQDLVVFDLWKNDITTVPINKNKECPVCGYKQYSFYGQNTGMQAAALCGRDSVQVIPALETELDFEEFSNKLKPYGNVSVNAFTLDFDDGQYGIKLFKNGRAIIKNVTDTNRAKSIYTKYIES